MGSEGVNKRQSKSKTIDLKATQKKRSVNPNRQEYFNPYGPPLQDVRRTTNLANSKKSSKGSINKKIESNNRQNKTLQYNRQTKEKNYSSYENRPSEVRQNKIRKVKKLSPKQIRRNKKRRQRQLIFKVSLIMIGVIGLVWGSFEMKEMLTYPKVSSLKVQKGTLDNSLNMDGIIVRHEKVYTSEGEGAIQYIATEGEKIGKNGKVSALVDSEKLVSAEDQKETVSNELYSAAEERKELSYYQDEDTRIDGEVKNAMLEFYNNRFKEGTDYIYSFRKQLDGYVDKRTNLYIKDQKQTNSEVTKELGELDKTINHLKQISYAPEAGVVSYMLDGKEELNSEMLETMDYKTFSEIKDKSKVDILSNTYVKEGQPLYKLITNDVWYIVTYVNPSQEEFFKEGQKYQLAFEALDDLQVEFTLKMKVDEEKHFKLVFESNEQGNKFLGIRRIQISIGDKKVEGLKIPLQSIIDQYMLKIPLEYVVEREGEKGVYRKKGEITEFVKLNIQKEKEGKAYVLQELGNVNAIQLKDTLTLPDNGASILLEEIEVTPGVYVINGKVAQFKPIEISIQNAEYAIIKQEPTSEVKELDKIISNPKSIKSDQLLDQINLQN